MKHLFKLFVTVFFVSVMLPSCKSNDDKLEKLTLQISMLSHQLNYDNLSADDVQRVVDKYESLTNKVPSSLVKLNKEEFMELYGSEAFIQIVSEFYYALSEANNAITTNSGDNALDVFNSLRKMTSDFEDEVKEISPFKSISTSSKNWDRTLDHFEKLVDNLIPLYKKISSGDVSVMASYSKCYSEYMELAEELDSAEDNMTPEQCERLMQITSRLTTALYGSDMGIGAISNFLDDISDEENSNDYE